METRNYRAATYGIDASFSPFSYHEKRWNERAGFAGAPTVKKYIYILDCLAHKSNGFWDSLGFFS